MQYSLPYCTCVFFVYVHITDYVYQDTRQGGRFTLLCVKVQEVKEFNSTQTS